MTPHEQLSQKNAILKKNAMFEKCEINISQKQKLFSDDLCQPKVRVCTRRGWVIIAG